MLASWTGMTVLVVSPIELTYPIQHIRRGVRMNAVHYHHNARLMSLINKILGIIRGA